MSYSINVLLFCQNAIIREGLSRILSDRDFIVVQSASSPNALAVPTMGEGATTPQLIVLDNASEECDADCLVMLQERFPRSHLVMLSDRFEFRTMLKAFQLGIQAYIVKEISCERLVGTLRLVAMGERVLPPQLADELQSRPGLLNTPEVEKSAEVGCLSEREREILRWLIMGSPNKVISRKMEISEATVKVHVKAVLRKLKVKNRTQAAIWAANHGMRGRCYDVEPAAINVAPQPAQLPELAATQFAHL